MKEQRGFLMRRLGRNERAGVLIEFAIIIPVMLLLFAGVVEFGRYLLLREKLVNASNNLAQYVSQLPDPTNPGNLSNAFRAAMSSFDRSKSGVRVSTVTRASVGAPLSVSQRFTSGATGASRVNRPDGLQLARLNATFLPNAASPTQNDVGVLVESYYNHSTIIPGIGSFAKGLNLGGQIYQYSFVLKRDTQIPPQGGSAMPMPTPYGCCSYACQDKYKPTDVWCDPYCTPPNEMKPCAKTAAAAAKYGLKMCEPCPASGGDYCKDNPNTCACNDDLCNVGGN